MWSRWSGSVGSLATPVPMPCWAPHLAETIPPGLDVNPYVDFSASFLRFIHKCMRQEKREQGKQGPLFLPPSTKLS